MLTLRGCRIPPTLLGSVSAQLRGLKLISCYLLPCGLDRQLQPQRVAALLSALQRLTQLEDLELRSVSLSPTDTACPSVTFLR